MMTGNIFLAVQSDCSAAGLLADACSQEWKKWCQATDVLDRVLGMPRNILVFQTAFTDLKLHFGVIPFV